MRIGLQISNFTWPGGCGEIRSRLMTIGKTADEVGFSSLWVMDHFFQIPQAGKADDPMLESYSVLAHLAAITQHVRLGALVTGVIYHYPGILVKTVSTLDVLSGGRAYLGIGIAWFEREARGLGVPFPSTRERFEQLEETLQIAQQMWSGTVGAYHGKHFHLTETLNCPLPLTKPHPPILIGGGGEKKTLRLVAQYADACNLFCSAGAEAIRNKLEILRRHCEAVGRPYEAIERTAVGTINLEVNGMSVEQVLDFCHTMFEAGIQHLILSLPNVHAITPLEVFGQKIIPIVAQW